MAQQVACEAFFSFRGRRRRGRASVGNLRGGAAAPKKKANRDLALPHALPAAFEPSLCREAAGFMCLTSTLRSGKSEKRNWEQGQLLRPHVKQARERPSSFRSLSFSFPLSPPSFSSLQLPTALALCHTLPPALDEHSRYRLARQREGESAGLGGEKCPSGIGQRGRAGERSRWRLAYGLVNFFFSKIKTKKTHLFLPRRSTFGGLAATSP